jgi:hypothetical protein
MTGQDMLPDIDTPWRLSARELAEIRGWDFFRAYDHVVVNYLLSAGDVRPLLDLILRLRRAPGNRATEYIGAMIDRRLKVKFPNDEFLFDIGFEENRKRGRPSRHPNAFFRDTVCVTLVAGLNAIERDASPGWLFWTYLAAALDHEGYGRSKGANFPIKAKTQAVAGRKGRRRDPEIMRRNIVLASAVSDAMRSGCKYESAITDVLAEIERQGQAEQWKAWVGRQTIRDAYDGFAAKSALTRAGEFEE